MTDKYASLRRQRDRQCFRADGMPKMRYSRKDARARAAEFPGYHHYRCGACGGWHVGREKVA